MASKVKKINQSLDDIRKRASDDFALTGKAVTDPVVDSYVPPNRITVSYFDKTEPPAVGRASDVEAIINMLQASSSTQSPLTVVSIVGFGGLGKTTLARMVLHQVKETTKLFDKTIWVCVSEPFEVNKILKGMLEILDENTAAPDALEAIIKRLIEKLKDKRFLLVLDDVWEHDVTNCNTLKRHLLTICSRSGSFVIVTTRKLDVAVAMETQKEHVVKLKGLEDKECWDIIRNKCEMQWGESVPEDMEKIGVEIGIKCKGVPLAAKVVGGTLCKKKGKEEWSSIQNSDAWNQIDEHNEILPVLKLSFHHLHPSLKQCFVFCSLFPKDFEYEKQKLIELWMAEGFLNTMSTTNGGSSEKSMDAVGEECFNALIFHSFFQDVAVDYYGNVSCKMHDLLHDVAESVSNYKMLKWKEKSTFFVRTSDHQHQPTVQELESDGTRMVRCAISEDIGEVSDMFSTFKSLRSLYLSSAGLEELPSIVGRLKQLRYLDISHNSLMELPEFITKLYNLQSIWLIDCTCITKLPTNMVNLVRLRHIHFDMHYLEIYNVGRLIELRTLPYFVVREEEGFRIDELNELNELTGKLEISGLQKVRDKEEAERANLKEKKNLTKLILKWYRNSIDRKKNDEDVLEGLLPPPSIKSLKIENYRGVKFPNWNYLSQLEELTLSNCGKCEFMPSLGHLPHLKSLEVSWLENIRIIGSEFYGACNGEVTLFPQLRKFTLEYMMSLEEWVAVKDEEEKSVVVFPLLEKLTIQECPRLRSIPLIIENYRGVKFPNWNSFSQLERLILWNCGKYKLMPSLGHLPRLKFLELARLENIRIIGNDFYGECNEEVTLFPQLREFTLYNIESLEEWVAAEAVKDEGEKSVVAFPLLEKLTIRECPRLRSIPLRHLSSLVSLNIYKCEDMEYLSNDIQNLSSLYHLEIRECRNLVSLSNLQQLKSLKELRIHGCVRLTSLSKGLVSVETLGLYSCGDLSVDAFCGLSSLKFLYLDGVRMKSIPNIEHPSSLEDLAILYCPEITSVPNWLKVCTSLRKLHIRRCEKLISIEDDIISSLTQLKELELGPFSEKLEDFPGFNSIHHLLSPAIEELRLYGWEKLKSLSPQLQHLTSLRDLTLYSFEGVSSINDDIFSSLTQLKILIIGPFSEELDEFPGLTSIHLLSSSLETLYICGWPKLKSLPQHLQHLTSLKELTIVDFKGVETLPDWLANLSSLQLLKLRNCENLKELPTTIKSLSNLSMLDCFLCPFLEQRYNQDTGPDRNLISHVPNIYF